MRGVWLLLLAAVCSGSACIIEDDGDDGSDDVEDAPDGDKDAGRPDGGNPDGGIEPGGPVTKPDGGVLVPCAKPVNDRDCDKTKRPIVFVHGTVANGESFAHPALLFASNGYCPDRIRAIEYNSIPFTTCPGTDGGTPTATGMDAGIIIPRADAGAGDAGCVPTLDREAAYKQVKQEVDAVIAKLLKETGADKVDLAGHSQGAGHGAKYAGENPDKVAHYLSLAGGDLPADPGGVPTLCLSSTGDRPAKCGTTSNVVFDDVTIDHSAVSSSTEAFVEMYKFLNAGKEPKFKEVQCSDEIVIEGRALSFGDNKPLPGAKLELYKISSAPWQRPTHLKTFELRADGSFGPWTADAWDSQGYEFKMVPPPGDKRKPRRSYMPALVRSDRLLRFNFESYDPRASATGSRVNYDDSHAVIIARRRQKAFLFPRDSLKIDGFEVVSEQNTLTAAKRSTVTCALYLFDKSITPVSGPGDGKSTGESIIKGTFVDSADVFMQAERPTYISVSFNDGRRMAIPNWPSETEGASLVLVD